MTGSATSSVDETVESPKRRRFLRAVGWLLLVAVLSGGALVLWAPALGLGRSPLLAQSSAFRPQAMAGLAILGAILVSGRGARRVWGVTILVLALSPLPEVLPRAFADGSDVATSDRLTVLSVNVGVNGADVATVVRFAVDRQADVVALPEASESYAAEVVRLARAAGVEYAAATSNPLVTTDYENYRTRADGPYPTSLLVRASLAPVFDTQRPKGRLGNVTAQARTPSGAVSIAAVHPIPPLVGLEPEWSYDHRTLAELCAATTPTVLAGDFNSTLDQAPMRALIDAGCEDAAAATGHGLGGTWPTSVPGLLGVQIDHVLTTAATAVAHEVVDVPGSDHRGIVAVLALPAR